jgi:pyruvate,orthophosphate dikinase
MIELVRASNHRHEIAEYADFFSFAPYDLSVATFGLSRVDAGRFVLFILRRRFSRRTLRIHDINASVSYEDGVEREAAEADLEVGICGEHGGEPASLSSA